MTLLGTDKLEAFKSKHAAARKALGKWEQKVESASWKNLPELKQTFGSADYNKGAVVFNVGGNKYRITAMVQFAAGLVLIEKVETHPEYDRARGK